MQVGLQIARYGLADLFIVVEMLVRVVVEVCELEQVAAVLVDHAAVIVQVVPVFSVEHV